MKGRPPSKRRPVYSIAVLLVLLLSVTILTLPAHAQAGGQPVIASHAFGSPGVATSVTASISVMTQSILVAWATQETNVAPTGIHDSLGSTWTTGISSTSCSLTGIWTWTAFPTVGGSDIVNVTLNGAHRIRLFIVDVTGANGATSFDAATFVACSNVPTSFANNTLPTTTFPTLALSAIAVCQNASAAITATGGDSIVDGDNGGVCGGADFQRNVTTSGSVTMNTAFALPRVWSAVGIALTAPSIAVLIFLNVSVGLLLVGIAFFVLSGTLILLNRRRKQNDYKWSD